MTNNNDLAFVGKSKGYTRPQLGVDLSITLIDKNKTVALSFSQKACTILGFEYMQAAKLGNRLYFKAADENTGFMLSGRKSICTRKTSRLPAKSLGINADWVGYYNLQWDRERELIYVTNDHELKFLRR